MRALAALALLAAIVVACGASFNGPATSNAGDPCKGHLQCPRGCCVWASEDGYGADCIARDEERAGICVPVTVTNPGMNGMGAEARDAGADAR